jgi:hypothetical protein
MPINAIMSNCSGTSIVDAFERVVKSQIPHSRWISDRNYYLRKTKERVDAETSATLSRNRNKSMEEYIASSIIIHSSDGWTYLSRSVESLINGDIASAIHFAYYAELRSAMSLMAHEGVGIFNKKHIWYDAAKNPTLFGGYSTHSAVDKGMSAWANLPSKKDLIFSIIKVKNRTLEDWIRETGFSSKTKYSTSVISSWLKKWSIDLHLKEDQQLRNEMSYRPHFIPTEIDLPGIIDKLSQIWMLLEPTENNRFPLLDQYMLRIALEDVFIKSKGIKPIGDAYKLFITNIFNRLGEEVAQALFRFLLRQIEPLDPIIFTEAKKDSDINLNKTEPLPIICRAILMLRLSTGMASRLIENSSVDIADLRFWWEHNAFQHGLISEMPSILTPLELFTDISDSITEIGTIQTDNYNNLKSAFENLSGPLFCLKQFERSGIWGLGL